MAELTAAGRMADALIDGDIHRIRLSRLERDAPRVVFEGSTPIYVARHRERVVTITTRDVDWAEGSLDDVAFGPSGLLCVVVEDYLLEFLDLHA